MIVVPRAKKTTELKYIDPASLAKVMAAIYAVIGFVYGIVASFLLPRYFMADLSVGWTAGLGIATIIFTTIMFAVIGFAAGLVGAVLYNWIAEKIGGIRIRLQ